MTRAIVLVLVALAIACAPAVARADCARDAAILRAHLEDQARAAGRWNLGWQIAFGASTAIQLSLALTETNLIGDWDQDVAERTYVGTAKATIAVGFALALPLRVDVPPSDADRCVELAALRASVARTGRNQREAFWLNHLGGLALNLAGAGILWYRRSFTVGAISLAEAIPVGLLNVYTMPRGAWHTWREQGTSWSVAVTPRPDGWLVSTGMVF